MTDPVSLTGSIGSTLASTMAARPKDDPAKIKSAAQQFEALLIGQMMKSMHDADGGWLGAGDGDQSSSSAMDYGQEVFAQSMAANGGLGLASLVSKGLQRPSQD